MHTIKHTQSLHNACKLCVCLIVCIARHEPLRALVTHVCAWVARVDRCTGLLAASSAAVTTDSLYRVQMTVTKSTVRWFCFRVVRSQTLTLCWLVIVCPNHVKATFVSVAIWRMVMLRFMLWPYNMMSPQTASITSTSSCHTSVFYDRGGAWLRIQGGAKVSLLNVVSDRLAVTVRLECHVARCLTHQLPEI